MQKTRVFKSGFSGKLLIGALLLMTLLVVDANARPLIMEGKSTLYQRVLTRPATKMFVEPDENSSLIAELGPFEMFFVFERPDTGANPQDNWLLVGRSPEGEGEGWVREGDAVDWKQTVVAAFTNPAGRERTLVFRGQEEVRDVYGDENVGTLYPELLDNARNGVEEAGGPVISIEPETHIDIDRQFYLLPILSHSSIRMPTRQRGKLLEIASIPAREPEEPQSDEEILQNFKVGLVFVLDTTSSMGPYIEQTREAIRALNDRISQSPEGERFRFGLVGFRDNNQLKPELDYVTKSFLPLDSETTGDKFLEAIGRVETARTSSQGFNEDSIAGVFEALRNSDWEEFGGRYIVLITDAGPREPSELAKQGALAPRELNEMVLRDDAVVYTLHLKTPQGQTDHSYAERAYKDLSAVPNGAPLYYDVTGGDVAEFRRRVDQLASALEAQVQDAIAGRLTAARAQSGTALQQSTGLVGRAMQLAFLGREQGTTAPEIFRGWLTDRDPLDRSARPVEPRIMISRNELSTLNDLIKAAIEAGNQTIETGNSDTFFQSLRSAAAGIMRTPELSSSAENLGDLLGEYLEDLPYESDIISVTPEDWLAFPAARERELVDSLESKIAALETIALDPARWFPLYDGAPGGEHVTTLPLDLLP